MQKVKTGSKIKPSTSNIVFNILAYSLVAIVSIVCVLPFLPELMDAKIDSFSIRFVYG